MKSILEQRVVSACQELFNAEMTIELSRPQEQFGDYTTNVALRLSKQLSKNPREVAETIAAKLRETLNEYVSQVTIAGPGFINLHLNDQTLQRALQDKPAQSLQGQSIVAE